MRLSRHKDRCRCDKLGTRQREDAYSTRRPDRKNRGAVTETADAREDPHIALVGLRRRQDNTPRPAAATGTSDGPAPSRGTTSATADPVEAPAKARPFGVPRARRRRDPRRTRPDIQTSNRRAEGGLRPRTRRSSSGHRRRRSQNVSGAAATRQDDGRAGTSTGSASLPVVPRGRCRPVDVGAQARARFDLPVAMPRARYCGSSPASRSR